jgi:hypothetical protein
MMRAVATCPACSARAPPFGQQPPVANGSFQVACSSRQPHMLPAMLASLVPIAIEEPGSQLWEVGWARGVSRSALRAHLGDPFYVETDSLCTFGGEEDWWWYRSQTGEVLAVCLRVPYEDAVLCLSNPTEELIRKGAKLLGPWALGLFDLPRRR